MKDFGFVFTGAYIGATLRTFKRELGERTVCAISCADTGGRAYLFYTDPSCYEQVSHMVLGEVIQLSCVPYVSQSGRLSFSNVVIL